MNPSLPSLFHSEFDNLISYSVSWKEKGLSTQPMESCFKNFMQENLMEQQECCHFKPELMGRVWRSTVKNCLIALSQTEKALTLRWYRKLLMEGKNLDRKPIRSTCCGIFQDCTTTQSKMNLECRGLCHWLDRLQSRKLHKTITQLSSALSQSLRLKECLRQAERATLEVGQEYVIITFDIGVYIKAYPLVLIQPEWYQQHIILIEIFYLVCAYMKMIGRKMSRSGHSDILLEAGLISSGSLNGVLSGKQYDCSLHCHKVMLEILEWLLLNAYLKETWVDSTFPPFPE